MLISYATRLIAIKYPLHVEIFTSKPLPCPHFLYYLAQFLGDGIKREGEWARISTDLTTLSVALSVLIGHCWVLNLTMETRCLLLTAFCVSKQNRNSRSKMSG